MAPVVTRRRQLTTGVEVALAAAIAVSDLGIATFLLLAVMIVSLRGRHQRLSHLGLTTPTEPARMCATVCAVVVVCTVTQLALVMPVVEHATGSRHDVSQFDDLEGNLSLLVTFVALSWTLAAFGEELAYRGFVQTRAIEVLEPRRWATVGGVVIAAAVFGLAHTEQGAVGVVVTCFDAIVLSALRLRFRTLWAPMLAHGLSNTIGITAFYVAGPIHGLW